MSYSICQDKNILIRRNRLSRYLRLSINRKNQVVLSVPLFCSVARAQAFLTAHQDWIQNHLTVPLTFHNGDSVSVLGQSLTIRHTPTHRGGVCRSGDDLIVGGETAFLHRRITDYIKKETRRYIDTQARILATKAGLSVHQIHLKDTVSRWGSCSAKGNLNFCWRLGLAPLFVLDYIIAHEVAHLQEMNHGPRFWRLVSQLTDRRADAEIWLRRNGCTLR